MGREAFFSSTRSAIDMKAFRHARIDRGNFTRPHPLRRDRQAGWPAALSVPAGLSCRLLMRARLIPRTPPRFYVASQVAKGGSLTSYVGQELRNS
jgi:hypothetical protein